MVSNITAECEKKESKVIDGQPRAERKDGNVKELERLSNWLGGAGARRVGRFRRRKKTQCAY